MGTKVTRNIEVINTLKLAGLSELESLALYDNPKLINISSVKRYTLWKDRFNEIYKLTIKLRFCTKVLSWSSTKGWELID